MFKIWQVWKHELSLELIHHKFTDVQRASWRPKFIFQMIENSKFVFLVVYVSLYRSLHYAKTLRLLFMTSVTVSNKVVICNMFRKNCLFNNSYNSVCDNIKMLQGSVSLVSWYLNIVLWKWRNNLCSSLKNPCRLLCFDIYLAEKIPPPTNTRPKIKTQMPKKPILSKKTTRK